MESVAGDWIKMRVWLRRDPKVIRMSDTISLNRDFMNWLTDPVRKSCSASAYDYVTSDVTRALCVTGLLEVWGTAREQGNRNGDDLVVSHSDISTIDDICGIPGFGKAMANVGWVTESKPSMLIFHKFFTEKGSPSERFRSSAAERQARYRHKKRYISDVTGDVTGDVTDGVTGDVTGDVTVTVEKRREEKSIKTTPLPPKGGVGGWSDIFESLPDDLKTAAFETAWNLWTDHHFGKKKLTAQSVKLQIRKCATLGHDRAIAAIENSVTQNYQGLYEPNQNARRGNRDETVRDERAAKVGREYPEPDIPLLIHRP